MKVTLRGYVCEAQRGHVQLRKKGNICYPKYRIMAQNDIRSRPMAHLDPIISG